MKSVCLWIRILLIGLFFQITCSEVFKEKFSENKNQQKNLFFTTDFDVVNFEEAINTCIGLNGTLASLPTKNHQAALLKLANKSNCNGR